MLNFLKKINNNIFGVRKKRLSLMAVFYFLFFIPRLLLAQIEITEIMYDLEIGSDSGREWIEVFNSGTESIDLSDWKLYEAEINHKINPIVEGGNTLLSGGDYAILVDNCEKFKEDWPNFSGLVLDTAFSLKNTGETLVIRNQDLVDIDSVNYLPDWGANGDGKTLQKISGEWAASSPTLGLINSDVEEVNSLVEEGENSPVDEEIPVVTAPTTSSNSVSDFIEINIKAKIDSLEYFPVAGADFTFKGKALGLEDEVLENAKYQWSFGDGTKGIGQSVLHNFAYPGEYLVVMEVISGEYSRCDRLKVKVVPSEIIISSLKMSLDENFVELYNPSKNEINLSWWRLRSDNLYFTLPKNTILLPKAHLKLPFGVTKLLPRENSVVQLLYPNGMLAFNYSRETILEQKIKISNTIENSKISDKQEEIIIQESLVYSVEKPVEVENNVINSNNQTASIKDSLNEEKLNSVGVQPPQTGNSTEKSRFPLNKWSFMLGGITLIAVVGVSYATKLDSENEKPF